MRIFLRVLVLPLLFATPLHAGDPPGAFYKNSTWGYKVRVPKGWRRAALASGEMWIASKHLGKRKLEAVKSNWWVSEAPEMWVIGFPHAQRKDAGAYKGYDDFIKGQKDLLDWDEGPYTISLKKQTKIRGQAVTMYEITAQDRGKEHPRRRMVAFVYHFDDLDLAVQFKILEEHYDGFAASFRACMKSLQRIERTSAIPGTAGSDDTAAPDSRELDKLSPEERERALKDAAEKRFRAEIDRLHEGWKHRRSARYLVLYNAPEKFVRATITHAEAVHDHIEKFLGEKKKSEYRPPAIMRIFATEGEREAYRKAGAAVGGLFREVLVVQGKGYVKDNEYEALNKNILSAWLYSQHSLLEETAPGWIRVGLNKYVGMLRTRGKRVTLTNEDWDRDSMRLSIKKGEYTGIRNLIGRGLKRGGGGGGEIESYQRGAQERSVGLFLLTKGNRGKYKNLVRRYLSVLLRNIEDVEATYLREALSKAKKEKRDPNAASEQEWARGQVKAKIAEIRQETFDFVFGKWSAQDWERLTKAWLSDAK